MSISKKTPAKKQMAVVLVLLMALTTIPLLTVQASVDLLYFRAVAGASTITLEWATAQELDNLGFNLYRSTTGDFEDAQPLNGGLIAGNTGSPTGATYEWEDDNVTVGVQYTYWLEDIDINGEETLHDPVTAVATGGGAIPTQPNPGSTTSTPTPTRTTTLTPTPTTQSQTGGNATATPSRTATTTSSSTNPTATSQPQIQPTTGSTNTSTNQGNQPQSTPTSSGAVLEGAGDEEDATPIPTDTPIPTVETDLDNQPEEVSLLPAEQEESQNDSDVTAQPLGQGAENSPETEQGNSSDNGSNRSTAVTMALIISVVLLLAGVGGTVFLLVNRNKQMRT